MSGRDAGQKLPRKATRARAPWSCQKKRAVLRPAPVARRLSMMSITGSQLKAARELIGLSQVSLAVQFQLGLRAVTEFEDGRKPLSWQTLHHLKRALEATGLEFTNVRPGVKLQRPA